MIVAEEEELSVEEVCDQLIAELAAPEEGDETTLAQVQFFGGWGRRFRRAVQKAVKKVEHEAKKFVGKVCDDWSRKAGAKICEVK